MTLSQIKHAYKPYERWVPIAFFLLGFLFDALTLSRIDSIGVILQQALYLSVAALLVGIELVQESKDVGIPKYLGRVWRYREAFLHFLLGTLLNSYAIFYFKSASGLTAFIFIALLIGLLTVNEFWRFGKSQTQVHVAFLSLCLISFLISLAPVLMGFIGRVPFVCAMIASALAFSGFHAIIKRNVKSKPRLLRTHLLYPYSVIQLGIVVLYFINAIPPVPLSVKFMGIYHAAAQTTSGYELTSLRSKLRFWQHGDETFLARPGDVIHCFAQIFSPTSFKDQLQVRWLYLDEAQGWLPSDAVPMPVLGGRDEGYRAVTRKANFRPGSWRVQIETMDSQEIGRFDFDVVADDSIGERQFHVAVR